MRRRTFGTSAVASLVTGAALLACVDLFHGTDFDTLCSVSPDAAECLPDAALDVPDAVAADVGADSARPHPDFCSWSSNEARTQALRACAWLGACEGPLGESTFGPCVVHAQLAFNCTATPTLRPRGAVDAFWACLATASSCTEVDACVFPGGVVPCNEISAGSSSACGENTNEAVRVECSGPAGRAVGVEPCVMTGRTCSAENSSIATCSGMKGFACTTTECSGGSAVDCTIAGQVTFDRGVDCAGHGGGACVSTVDTPACAPGEGAGTCTTTATPVCEDAVATSCVAGKETRVNCAAVKLPCDVTQPVPAYDLSAACVDRGAGACNVPDTCASGSVLQSCGRGATFTVDCATLGLGKCKINSAGRASCTAPPG
jgi:hypothetical protein